MNDLQNYKYPEFNEDFEGMIPDGESGGGSSLPEVTASDNGKVLSVVSGEWNKADAPKELPNVSASDNGKVLSVVSGEWGKADAPKELPSVTASDNGKVLSVVNGTWNKATPSGGSDLPSVTSADNGDVLTVVNGAWDKATPSGGGALLVSVDENRVLNKTFGEIRSAFISGRTVIVSYEYAGEFTNETVEHFTTVCAVDIDDIPNDSVTGVIVWKTCVLGTDSFADPNNPGYVLAWAYGSSMNELNAMYPEV